MHVADSALELIGRTPLVRLRSAEAEAPGSFYGKLERCNPLGSVKERTALAMVENAEERGALTEGGTLVEATSGNTGIALAMVAAVKRYRVILTLPDTMSNERRRMLTALGAELVLTPGSQGMAGAVEEAQRIAARLPGALMLGQFDNPANPRIHERTTAEEIWRDTAGEVDVVVAGIGTGGTATGIARGLKRKKPGLRVLGVEPASSPVLSGGEAGAHAMQGIGAGFIPTVLDQELLDDVIIIDDHQARAWTRRLARCDGLFVGISSGAAVAAAVSWGKRTDAEGATVVVILPDGGEKYLSTGAWESADE